MVFPGLLLTLDVLALGGSMNKRVLRSGDGSDFEVVSAETGLSCPPEESVVQQQFSEEVDINTIVRRFGLTGMVPVVESQPIVGGFAEVVDYQSALNAVIRAEEAFMSVPGTIRARFDHDPGKFLAFIDDPANADELVTLGLRLPVVAKVDGADGANKPTDGS